MPMEGKGVLARLGRRRRVAARPHVDADVDQRPAGDRRQARSSPSTGSRWSRPTSAAASGSRSCTRGRRRSWSRGPRSGSADRSSGPRTGASTSSRRRTSAASCTRSSSATTTTGLLLGLVGRVLARQRRLHAVRADRADHHRDPAARPVQARRLPGRVPEPLHQHRARHALPRAPAGRRAAS